MEERTAAARFGSRRNKTEWTSTVAHIEIAPRCVGERCALILWDGHSRYAWLYATCSNAAEEAASAIVDWHAAYGTSKLLLSDEPTHSNTKIFVC